jgi:hypothetical protein
MVGQPSRLDIMSDLMWEAFRQIQDGKLVLADQFAWDLGEGWRPVWRKVHPDWIEDGRLHFALWHRRYSVRHDHDLRAYQLVFCNVDSGLFPWDEGFPDERREGQVDFYSPIDGSRDEANGPGSPLGRH